MRRRGYARCRSSLDSCCRFCCSESTRSRISSVAIEGGFLRAAWNSIFLASVTAAAATALALVFTYAPRVARQRPHALRPARGRVRLCVARHGARHSACSFRWRRSTTVVDALARSLLGVSTGLIFSGSIAALVYAYVIRFLAVAPGGIEAGLERISHNLDAAARALGETAVVRALARPSAACSCRHSASAGAACVRRCLEGAAGDAAAAGRSTSRRWRRTSMRSRRSSRSRAARSAR